MKVCVLKYSLSEDAITTQIADVSEVAADVRVFDTEDEANMWLSSAPLSEPLPAWKLRSRDSDADDLT